MKPCYKIYHFQIFFNEKEGKGDGDNKNYISILDLDLDLDLDLCLDKINEYIIDIEIPEKIKFGFHSIFVKQ